MTNIYTVVEITSNNSDYFQTVYEGYDQNDAISNALSELRYACCSDFTTPSACRKGTSVSYFTAEGYDVPADMDEYDFAESMGWEYAVFFKVNGKQVAFPPNFAESYEYHNITSDEVRQFDSWDKVMF